MGDTDMHLFSLWHASIIIMNLVPVCTMCMGRLCETTQRHGSFAWAVAWRCATCHVHFYCCDRTCGPKTRQITAFASHDQLVRHHRRQHKRRLVSDDAEVDFGDDLLDVPESPRGSIPFPMDAFNMFGAHAPAKRFFDDLQARSFGAAVQGLVARSCFSDARVLDLADTGISVADLTLFFRIARLVFQLGPKHQHLLAGVLAGFETRHPPPSGAFTHHPRNHLQLPTTHKAFVAKLLNQSNTNSLTSILPLPPTIGLSGKHAYVSIPALVAYDLGLTNSNVDPPHNAKYVRLVNSAHGQALFRRAKVQLMAEETALTTQASNQSCVPLVVLFLMWFDGWDPNGSSKGNRSPVWSGSLTLVFIDRQGHVVSVSTYPFAAGPGKADHDVIFQQILLDVRAMQAPLDDSVNGRRWYYSRAAAQMALVYGELFCIWQDQPARRQETNLLGGNSNNHAIFGTSCYVAQLQKPIVACASCREATTMYLTHGNFQTAVRPVCAHCTNWRFPEDPQSSLYHSDISDKFPVDAVAGQAFNRGAGQIETSLLTRAWREACTALVAGRWTDGTVQTYLKTLCVNESTVKAMINQCRDHVLWNEIGADPEGYDEATKACYRRKFAANPQQFALPAPPAAWMLAPLALHVETVMHLAGGVQKAVAKFVHRYATSLGNGPALITRLAFPIALMHKYCRVQHLPLAAYNTDKFGGWVMENYKSLCKLAPWLYHCFEDAALQKPTPFVMPTKARSAWTLVENKGYLRSRDIATPKNMNAKAAKIAVNELFDRAGGPPDAVLNAASAVDPRDMRRLWWSCSSMFKDLMRVKHDTATINRTDARVRAFLSDIESLDAALQPARAKPLYLAKYNFPSLLRAVTHLKPFGNIRDLHEGGIEGEAMVKVLRPLLPNGLKDRFAHHLLRKALRDTTVDRLLLNLEAQDSTRTNQWLGGLSMITPRATRHDHDLTDDDTSASTSSNDSDDEQEDDPFDDPFGHMRHVLDDADIPGDDVAEPSTLLFRRYSTLALVESYLTLGVPVSVVLTNHKGPQRIGVIVATCNEWWLLPLRLGEAQFDDDLGFTYFQVELHPQDDQMLVRTKHDCENPTYHMQLLNYATLLPALWLQAPVPYALITMEGDHLDANYNFV
jgi:hypothetical protein